MPLLNYMYFTVRLTLAGLFSDLLDEKISTLDHMTSGTQNKIPTLQFLIVLRIFALHSFLDSLPKCLQH